MRFAPDKPESATLPKRDWLRKVDPRPALRVSDFGGDGEASPSDPQYIEEIAHSITSRLDELAFEPRLAASGVKRLAVVTPGFSVDCLETIEEIGRENAGYFYAAGGEEFARIACLNDGDGGIRVIEAIVLRELQGWI
jgi:Ferrochelatase